MSGIGGIYNIDGRSVDRDLLNRMTESIRHRGQDDGGIWIDGCVGLGHRQLWTTEESYQEKQPLSNRDGTSWITCDGRVDNREELIRELRSHGIEARELTDAQLILQAYEVWDVACVQKILGDFAFAIWDGRRGRLFCGRDPIGMRTFYYHFDGRRFIFGSEIQELLQDTSIPHDLNEEYIADYLISEGRDRDRTPYRYVCRLMHAHFLVVDKGGVSTRCYWDLVPERPIRYKREEEYAEHFRGLFREAVRCRLRSRGPIGALLSGGLDSSSVVCMAQEMYKAGEVPDRGFATFTLVFDKYSSLDERGYMQEVVKKYGLTSYCIQGDDLWPLKEMPPQQDEPFMGVNYSVRMAAMQKVRDVGTKVLLTGWAGDSVVTGNLFYIADLLVSLRVARLATELKRFKEGFNQPWLTILRSYVLMPLLPPSVQSFLRAIKASVKREDIRPVEIAPWINPDFSKRLRLRERRRKTMASKRFFSPSTQSEHKELSRDSIRIPALWIDQYVALPLSIQTRHPFLDTRLIHFSLAIPTELKMHFGVRKVILRQALIDILPESVRSREDKTLINLVKRGLEKEWPKIQKMCSQPYVSALGYVDRGELVEALEQYRLDGTSNEGHIWNTLTLEIWLRRWARDHPLQGAPQTGALVERR